MTLPHLTTRSLAQIALLVSVITLVLTLARPPAGGWSVPHTSAPSALAASPKTELGRSLTTRDPSAARAYYLAKTPEDLTTYTHPVYDFAFPYLKDFTVEELEDEQGALMLVEHPAVGMGFQLFIAPDDETGPLTAERIQRDLPDMFMDEVTEFTLPDETPAVRFVSRDPVLGAVGETWFTRDGYLFELSVSAPDRELQDAWLREIAANLTSLDESPEGETAQ